MILYGWDVGEGENWLIGWTMEDRARDLTGYMPVSWSVQQSPDSWGAPRDHVPGLSAHTEIDPDLVATLLEAARAGEEATFRELAMMRGVPAEEIPAMWAGTRLRVGETA